VALVILGIMALAAGGVFYRDMVAGFDEASTTGEALSSQYGGREDWAPDRLVPLPERLEAFVEVRRRLEPSCAAFVESFAKMNELDEKGSDEKPSLGEMFDLLATAMSLPKGFGAYLSERNRALTDVGMGLGEYLWLRLLTHDAGPVPISPEDDEAYTRRSRGYFMDMLERGQAQASPEDAAAFAAELEAMQANQGRRPFEDALPDGLADALAGHHLEHGSLYCKELSNIELSEARSGGGTIQIR
jgi:hypothetical protein